METLVDVARANTARLQEELQREIEAVESGIRTDVSASELNELRAKLAAHEALLKQYAHLVNNLCPDSLRFVPNAQSLQPFIGPDTDTPVAARGG